MKNQKRRYIKNVVWNEEINKRCRKVIVVKRPLFMMQFLCVLKKKRYKKFNQFSCKNDLCNFFYPVWLTFFKETH